MVSFDRYVLGLVVAMVAFGAVVLGARALRRGLLPQWTGAPAVLVDVVLAIAAVVVMSEAAGTVGLFRLGPVVALLTASGLAMLAVGRRLRRLEPLPARDAFRVAPPTNRVGRPGTLVALGMAALLTATWAGRTVAAFRHGMDSIDTLWYHLPFAARFAQDGSVTALHFVSPEPLIASYPATSSLLHGLGIVVFDSDLASPLLNFGWLAIALLAAWCIGRPAGVGWVTMAGAVIVMGTPAFVVTQAAGGYNDVAGVACILASVAILANSEHATGSPRSAEIAIAAIAAGLALGMKVSLIAPVGALSLGWFLLARAGERIRRVAWWMFALTLAGGFWYVRNVFAIGNPVPGVELGIGDVRLPNPEPETTYETLAHYLFDGDAWDRFLLPGLSRAFGPGWWALLGLAGAGLLLVALTGRRPFERMLGVVGIAMIGAFVVTPQLLGFPGAPFFFYTNLRYAAPGVTLGLVLLPLAGPLLRGRRPWWVLGAYTALLLVTQLDPSIWPTELWNRRFAEPVQGLDAQLGILIGIAALVVGAALLVGRDRVVASTRAPRTVAIAATMSLVVASLPGYAVQRMYGRERYRDTAPFEDTYKWARRVHDARIGVVGGQLFMQYPFYGTDLSNFVQYVGSRGSHGSFFTISECAQWRRVLNRDRYSFVVVAPTGFLGALSSPHATWTETDPAATLVGRGDDGVSVYRIDGRLDPEGCRLLPAEQRTASTPA